MLFLLGRMAYDDKRYAAAVQNFDAAAEMKQPRLDRLNGRYYSALALIALGDYEQARERLTIVARKSPDLRQAYDASIQLARCEQALGHYDRANNILEHLRDADRFFTYAEDTELELARLKVEAGQIDQGIEQYEEFITRRTSGERRALAFYRLALIHRDHRVDLPRAKALLDSVQRAGAAKAIADSAQAALEQISKGLLALDRIRSLQERLSTLDSTAVMDSVRIANTPRSAMLVPKAEEPVVAPADSTASLPSAAPALPVNTPPIDTAAIRMIPDSLGANRLPTLADSGGSRRFPCHFRGELQHSACVSRFHFGAGRFCSSAKLRLLKPWFRQRRKTPP